MLNKVHNIVCHFLYGWDNNDDITWAKLPYILDHGSIENLCVFQQNCLNKSGPTLFDCHFAAAVQEFPHFGLIQCIYHLFYSNFITFLALCTKLLRPFQKN